MSSVATEPPPPLPGPRHRRRSAVFIAAFVALQFLVPLTYLGREDRSDERFTWRMTQGPSALECDPVATVQTSGGEVERVELESVLHQEWVDLVERNRQSVVEAWLRKQCEAAGAIEAMLVNRCNDALGVREYRLACGSPRHVDTDRTAAR